MKHTEIVSKIKRGITTATVASLTVITSMTTGGWAQTGAIDAFDPTKPGKLGEKLATTAQTTKFGSNLENLIVQFGNWIMAGSVALGMTLVAVGFFNLYKAAKDESGRTEKGASIWMLAAGALLSVVGVVTGLLARFLTGAT